MLTESVASFMNETATLTHRTAPELKTKFKSSVWFSLPLCAVSQSEMTVGRGPHPDLAPSFPSRLVASPGCTQVWEAVCASLYRPLQVPRWGQPRVSPCQPHPCTGSAVPHAPYLHPCPPPAACAASFPRVPAAQAVLVNLSDWILTQPCR
jgi:hypothetical protein